MKLFLNAIGLSGLILFGLLLALTFGLPESIEHSAKGFIKSQIEHEISAKYQQTSASSISQKALLLADKLGFEQQQIEQDLKDKLPEKIAEVIASMCGYDCERKKQIATSITAGYLDRLASIQIAQTQIKDIIKGKYLEITGNLIKDLRIFLSSNSTMFLLLLLISLLKPRAVAHLFLPACLLLIATITATAIYLFGQNWFYTILYNDYMGFAYLGYIALIFAFLMDVVFNGAQITTAIINGILNAIGSALSVSPC